ncbi:hypothetical protein HF872_07645 [Megasphaera hexanoica]|uniref:Uncharacterized protein n=1 Tax=Megasphaera hexanoica TaxID=1675036 RepID=A0A848BUN1_9FIRM|nr:ESPR-type extended signal peptide-containing protein [Megasphaera hexanoica]NME28498.1 hypothetical protein [Megasphaera hexanoica]
MNKIYKVIWSHVKQCYVVTSELAKAHGRTSIGGRTSRLAVAALTAFVLTAGVTSVGLANTVTDANDNTITNTDTKITDINANITGKENKVIDSSNAEIVGDNNTVTNEVKDGDKVVAQVRSNDARIVGSNNTISGSRNQQVIGDHNTIIGRDKGTVTDYGHPEGRDLSVADITIGRENTIHSGDTYRNEWDSLTVIGNHNIADSKLVDSAGGPASGIVVGSNQNIDGIEESIVIGSLSPAEQNEKTDNPNHHDKYTVGRNSIILGNHASNTMGESIVVGNRSQGNGEFQTIMGHRSIIQGYADQSEANHIAENYGALSSIYGAFNTIESARPVFEDSSNYDPYFKAVDGFGNSINGTLNKTSSARGTMIMGAANTVTNSQPDIIKANVFGTDDSMDDVWLQDVTSAVQYYNLGDDNNLFNLSYDDAIAAMKAYAANASGAVSVLGNGNAADYAIRSQILGTANTLTGNPNKISANNTINGYGNTGTNITHSAVVGSNNTLSNGEDNVVIGDYHNMNGGKHNVVLGSMKSKEQTSQKEYKSPVWQDVKYNVTEQVPVKEHKNDIENAVMVGYNTDATVDGGVALGSDSIASTKVGVAGYDALKKTHVKSDKDYATWVSTDAAVSVGGADREVTYDVLDKDGKPVIDKATGKKKQETQIVKSTRQITNLAAGTEDTDAANVAQLKSVDKKVAVVFDDKGSLMSTDATIAHQILEDSVSFPDGEGQSIALGKGAKAFMQGGRKAQAMLFGMKKAAGAIAIGEGSEALSQSIDIGNRTYTGDIGDVTISKYGNAGSGSGVGSVLLGTNSYTGGTLSTLIGDYSIMSTAYPNGYDSHYGSYLQNAGAVSVGALNSIESATSDNYNSGVANSIVGLANKTNNANGALIYGAGNEITNSTSYISAPTSGSSAKSAAKSLRTSIKNNPGGAVLAIGGGNTIDRSIRSQVMGVNNTLTGNSYYSEYSSQYNMIDGYNNTASNVNHAYVIGANNNIQGKTFSDATKDGVLSKADRDKAKKDDNLIVIGDNHTLANDVTNNIILGTADETLTTSVSNVVMIGHNADAQKEGGVALGADSVAAIDKDAVGYDPTTKQASTDTSSTWKSTAAAVSVGDASKKITRQITNVAAGTQDTDAVNVAQLKAVSDTVDASKTKYYSVRNIPYTDQLGTYAAYTNENNDGAKEVGALAAGYLTYAGGIASTVTGSLSGVIKPAAAPGSRDFRGATALSYGTFNINNNSDKSGAHSGVANSIVGQANMTTDSNAALIYGAGNVISNSYRDIDTSKMGAIAGSLKDPKALGEALQAAVPTSGGQVMAFGGGNVVDNAYMTQVIGVGNTVKGNQKKNNDGTWISKDNTGFNDDTSSQLNYVDGFYTTLINGKNDYLIGAHNTVTGDSVENNHSNIVIGDNHTLENQSHNIILGSADSALPTTASQVTILGHNANATVNGGVALGYGSIANRAKGSAGLDLSLVTENGKAGGFSKDSSPVWKSNAAAVSVGHIATDAEGKLDLENTITRQITGVAAGSEDYDAVNVAQLRQVVDKMNYYTVKEGDKVKITVPPALKDLTNKNNDGAKSDYGMAAGYLTHTTGIASTVSGSFSGITTAAATTDEEKKGTKYQGVAALSYGTFNYNRNDHKDQQSAGAVNSLVGQSNLAENSNAAQIYGSANSIKNSYRHISMDEIEGILNDNNPETSTPDNVMEKLQKTIADEKTGGMVTIVGSANTADTAYMTQIQGVSNTVKGTTTDESKATTHNYVGGFFNELQNGKNNYIIGTKNTIKGSDDSTTNESNVIIGDNHKLTNGSHNVIIGSEDAEEAGETPAARYGLRLMAAEGTENNESPDRVVRVGYNAKATVDDGVALGSGSVASTEAGVFGYDPLTGIASTFDNKTWKSTWAAASIGDSNHTRQLTNVAAGAQDTDAVNVAQLKAVASKVGSVMKLVAGDGISIVNKDGVYTISANIKGGSTPTDDVKVDPEKPGEGGNTSGATTDTPVTPVDPGNTGNTDNPGNTENPSNGNGLIITAETKPTNFGADSGEATAVKPGENLAIKGDTTNITTTASDHGITVSLKKDITVDSVTAGETKMTSDGLTITGGPSITRSGIDAGGKKVIHVADGEIAAESKDAVNGSQLYRVQKNVESIENNVINLAGDVTNLNGRVSNLDNRINKVGAGAAALAALHPLDFNPDDKWNFAVGYGNYRNANSVALGAFYQPNENTMFNVATNFGNGENMINAGVSFKIGKGNSYAGVSKAQLVAENQQLKANDALQDQKIQKQDQEIQELKKALEELKSRIK